MTHLADDVKKELDKRKNPEKAAFFPYFFKTGKGQYGEGDKFIGVSVPDQRQASKLFKDLPLSEIKKLLSSRVHEHRLTAVFILVLQFSKTKKIDERQKIFDFYLEHKRYINNWDLVDSSAGHILGQYLLDKDRKILQRLARSKSLWDRRIAIIATQYFIGKGDFKDTLRISEMLLHDTEDLIHKAVGWMLREVGNKNLTVEEKFLDKHYKKMPRTMLRYAIEKFFPEKRAHYLSKD